MKKNILPMLIIGSILVMYVVYFFVTVSMDSKSFIVALKETVLLGIVTTAITAIVLIYLSKKDSEGDN